jgi:hypothetical protein
LNIWEDVANCPANILPVACQVPESEIDEFKNVLGAAQDGNEAGSLFEEATLPLDLRL